ncbi:hypothetical protein ACFLVL_02955 [Chloroflexota bacterium]
MNKMGIVLVPLLLLAIIVSAAGCSEDRGEDWSSSYGSGMKFVPADASAGMYAYVDRLNNDETLQDIYKSFAEAGAADGELSDFGIEILQMEHIVSVFREYETAGVAVGKFDFDNVRTHLEELDFTRENYNGVEFWTGYYGEYGDAGVAFSPDSLVWGGLELVESIALTMEGIDDSYEDVVEVKEVLKRFPEWTPLMTTVALDAEAVLGIPGAKNGGYTITKGEGGHLDSVWAINFLDTSTALEVGNLLGSSIGATSDDIEQDGTWVVIEAEMSIEDVST